MKSRLGRSAIGILDQGMSAFGNLILLLCVASQVSADGFGRFSLVYAGYIVSLGLSRSLNSEPLIVTRSGTTRDERATGHAMAGSLFVGVACAAVLLVVALAWLSSADVMVFAFFLPLLLLQDVVRMALLTEGSPSRALMIDTIWTVGQVGLLGVAIGLHRNDVATYIVAWGVPGVVATGVGLWFLRTLPRFRGVLGHQRATGPLSRRYASEFLSGAGALQAIHFAIAGAFGVAAIGALRAAQTLLGPFNQLLTGLNVGLMPEMVRLRKERPQRLRIVVASVSVAGAGAVMLGTLLLAATPEALGSELLGETWPNARRLILPAGLAIAGNMFIVGPLLGLRALGAATSSLTARLICSVLTVVSSLGVLAAGGSLGAVVWSIGISVWLGALIWWFVFLRAHERAENAPLSAIAGELATREVH